MRIFSLPWRAILSIYGGFLFGSNLIAIGTKLSLVNDARTDPAMVDALNDQIVMNGAVCAVGVVLLALGLVLAIRKQRSRSPL